MFLYALLLLTLAFPIGASSQEQQNTSASGNSTGITIEDIRVDGIRMGDFVVGPGKVEVAIEPGESKIVEMTVSNRTGEARQFNLEIEDLTGSNDPERTVVLLGDDRGPYSLRDYIKLPAEHFDLENGQRARVKVEVGLPPDAEPGGRYGSVLVTTVSKDAVPGNTLGAAPQSAIVSRIGTLFFVTTPGDVEREGALEHFATIPERKWFSQGPISFEILFRNTGSIHLNPYGEVRIHNMFGEEVDFVELEPWFALPNSLRFREIEWNRDFLFGRYTATAQINRGYDDVIDSATVTFWVVPWVWLLGAFAVLFIIFFLIRTFLRTFELKRKSS